MSNKSGKKAQAFVTQGEYDKQIVRRDELMEKVVPLRSEMRDTIKESQEVR